MKNRVSNAGELNLFGQGAARVEAAYDPNSKYYLRTVQIYDALQGPGTDMPVMDYLYKGQTEYNQERILLDHLNAEFVNQRGLIGEYYVTSYDQDYDKFFGEDGNPQFLRKFDFMLYSEEIMEPDYSFNMWGIWADNTYNVDVAKRHFLVASTKAGIATPDIPGVEQDFQYQEDIQFESMAPRIGDHIKVKMNGLYFEVTNVKNRYTSLQGTSFWTLTLKLMKDNQIKVSDEYGMADEMQDIDNPCVTNQKDSDLFNMRKIAREEADDVKYNETTEEKGSQDPGWNTNGWWENQ
jgi:hypothetical protein